MNTVKINSGKTKMVAHRGVCGLERENTYPAFLAAANRGYYGIETDIQVMADGSFVAMHDDDLWRVSLGASALNISKSTADDIKDIVLPDLDGSVDRKDIRIPMLCDYVNICKKYGKRCILEVKNRFRTEDIARMIEEIRSLDYLDNVVFISIDYENCVDLRRLLPDAEVQYLTGQRMDDTVIKMLTDIRVDAGFDIDYANPSRNKERIDLLHSLGMKVNVCVCDDPRLGEELALLGADYLTTNILE